MIENNLTIVIPYFNGENFIQKLLASIPENIQVVVVDDLSDRPFEDLNISSRNLRSVRLEKKGYFTGAVNRGIELCSTDVLVLNQDSIFSGTSWLAFLEDNHSRYALIGERIKGDHPLFPGVGYAHGTFWWIRRDAIRSVGLLNEIDYPLWGSTAEWQLRASRKGFEVLPAVSIPDYVHLRPKRERFGQGIKELLGREESSRLVRTPPALSVIVPCYNYGRYLRDCINSLIGGETCLGYMTGQALQSFEIIIVDDCSTDGSDEIGKSLEDPFKAIKFFQTPVNSGTATTLNVGISEAVGKYVTFLSADDMRTPESLDILYRVLEEHPDKFVYDDMVLFNGNRKIKQWRMEEYDPEKLLYKNHIHAGIMYPKEAWAKAGGYPPSMGRGREDWAFNIALSLRGYCGMHVENYGYLYRREGQNRSLTNTDPKHRRMFLEELNRLFPEAYREGVIMACCGKGDPAPKKLVSSSDGGIMSISSTVGSKGMSLLEYTGSKMSSTWTGPATHVSYRFGADKRFSWVDTRDVGERNKSGFLNMKDSKGSWVFRMANPLPQEPEQQEVSLASSPKVVEEIPTADSAEMRSEPKISVPNPSDLLVSQIRELDLTHDEWMEVYKLELADRNRKTVIVFIEEILAGEPTSYP